MEHRLSPLAQLAQQASRKSLGNHQMIQRSAVSPYEKQRRVQSRKSDRSGGMKLVQRDGAGSQRLNLQRADSQHSYEDLKSTLSKANSQRFLDMIANQESAQKSQESLAMDANKPKTPGTTGRKSARSGGRSSHKKDHQGTWKGAGIGAYSKEALQRLVVKYGILVDLLGSIIFGDHRKQMLLLKSSLSVPQRKVLQGRRVVRDIIASGGVKTFQLNNMEEFFSEELGAGSEGGRVESDGSVRQFNQKKTSLQELIDYSTRPDYLKRLDQQNRKKKEEKAQLHQTARAFHRRMSQENSPIMTKTRVSMSQVLEHFVEEKILPHRTADISDLAGTINHSKVGRKLDHERFFQNLLKSQVRNENFIRKQPAILDDEDLEVMRQQAKIKDNKNKKYVFLQKIASPSPGRENLTEGIRTRLSSQDQSAKEQQQHHKMIQSARLYTEEKDEAGLQQFQDDQDLQDQDQNEYGCESSPICDPDTFNLNLKIVSQNIQNHYSGEGKKGKGNDYSPTHDHSEAMRTAKKKDDKQNNNLNSNSHQKLMSALREKASRITFDGLQTTKKMIKEESDNVSAVTDAYRTQQKSHGKRQLNGVDMGSNEPNKNSGQKSFEDADNSLRIRLRSSIQNIKDALARCNEGSAENTPNDNESPSLSNSVIIKNPTYEQLPQSVIDEKPTRTSAKKSAALSLRSPLQKRQSRPSKNGGLHQQRHSVDYHQQPYRRHSQQDSIKDLDHADDYHHHQYDKNDDHFMSTNKTSLHIKPQQTQQPSHGNHSSMISMMRKEPKLLFKQVQQNNITLQHSNTNQNSIAHLSQQKQGQLLRQSMQHDKPLTPYDLKTFNQLSKYHQQKILREASLRNPNYNRDAAAGPNGRGAKLKRTLNTSKQSSSSNITQVVKFQDTSKNEKTSQFLNFVKSAQQTKDSSNTMMMAKRNSVGTVMSQSMQHGSVVRSLIKRKSDAIKSGDTTAVGEYQHMVNTLASGGKVVSGRIQQRCGSQPTLMATTMMRSGGSSFLGGAGDGGYVATSQLNSQCNSTLRQNTASQVNETTPLRRQNHGGPFTKRYSTELSQSGRVSKTSENQRAQQMVVQGKSPQRFKEAINEYQAQSQTANQQTRRKIVKIVQPISAKVLELSGNNHNNLSTPDQDETVNRSAATSTMPFMGHISGLQSIEQSELLQGMMLMNSAIGDKKFLDDDIDDVDSDNDSEALDKSSTDCKNEQNFPSQQQQQPHQITADQQHHNDEINKKRTGSRQKQGRMKIVLEHRQGQLQSQDGVSKDPSASGKQARQSGNNNNAAAGLTSQVLKMQSQYALQQHSLKKYKRLNRTMPNLFGGMIIGQNVNKVNTIKRPTVTEHMMMNNGSVRDYNNIQQQQAVLLSASEANILGDKLKPTVVPSSDQQDTQQNLETLREESTIQDLMRTFSDDRIINIEKENEEGGEMESKTAGKLPVIVDKKSGGGSQRGVGGGGQKSASDFNKDLQVIKTPCSPPEQTQTNRDGRRDSEGSRSRSRMSIHGSNNSKGGDGPMDEPTPEKLSKSINADAQDSAILPMLQNNNAGPGQNYFDARGRGMVKCIVEQDEDSSNSQSLNQREQQYIPDNEAQLSKEKVIPIEGSMTLHYRRNSINRIKNSSHSVVVEDSVSRVTDGLVAKSPSGGQMYKSQDDDRQFRKLSEHKSSVSMKDIEIAKHFTQLTPISGETDEIRDQSQKPLPLQKEDQKEEIKISTQESKD